MKLKTGSIIEVLLQEIKKFIYLKYIDVRDLRKDVSYPFQFRILNGFYDKCFYPTGDLDFSNLLISPLHLSGFDELIKIGDWKVVGQESITELDKHQHHYKMNWPPNLMAKFEDVKSWRVLKNINNLTEGLIVPYNRCAHLEYAESLDCSYLPLRVIIEYYKSKQEEYNFSKKKWDIFDHVLFSRYVNMPLYTDVPDEFKGKLLPEGI